MAPPASRASSVLGSIDRLRIVCKHTCHREAQPCSQQTDERSTHSAVAASSNAEASEDSWVGTGGQTHPQNENAGFLRQRRQHLQHACTTKRTERSLVSMVLLEHCDKSDSQTRPRLDTGSSGFRAKRREGRQTLTIDDSGLGKVRLDDGVALREHVEDLADLLHVDRPVPV